MGALYCVELDNMNENTDVLLRTSYFSGVDQRQRAYYVTLPFK